MCEQIAAFWESLIFDYGHVVKFGRINREFDYSLLSKLPFKIQIVPTIFSMVAG